MYRWPGGILNYELSQVVRSEHAALIRNTLSQLETKLDSWLKFREANCSPQVVVGDSGDVCQASVGFRVVKVKSSPLATLEGVWHRKSLSMNLAFLKILKA